MSVVFCAAAVALAAHFGARAYRSCSLWIARALGDFDEVSRLALKEAAMHVRVFFLFVVGTHVHVTIIIKYACASHGLACVV